MRILNQRLNFKNGIFVTTPSLSVLYEASIVYCQIYENAISESIMTDEDAKQLLITQRLWNDQKENELNDILPKHIEYWKEKLYLAYFRSSEQKQIKKYLDVAKKTLNDMNYLRHMYDHATCSGVANYAKLQFIIEHCTYKGKRRYNWQDFSQYQLMNFYQDSLIKEENIRELSHNHPWDIMWSVGKKINNVFGKPAIKLSFDQHRLVMWSSLYDSVNEQSEPPPAEVINDDDMLDGWLSLKRKNKLATGDNKVTSNDKISNAQEIYVPVLDWKYAEENQSSDDFIKDANKIDALNSQYGKTIKKQRFKSIEKHGTITEANLPDVKRELIMQMTQKATQSLKGR